MNESGIFNPAFYFPFCALAARYKDDSLDGDNDPFDCIEDVILTYWLPGAKIHRFWDAARLDFAYAVEDVKAHQLLIVALGTEGGALEAAWKDNFSPGIETRQFKELGGHVGFISSGQRLFSYFFDLINKYAGNMTFVGHSRGKAKAEAAARAACRLTGEIPTVIGYCGPAVFTPDGADEYDKLLGTGTITVRNAHDIVDDIGFPILRHVGTRLDLHYDRGKNPLPFVDGHKYTSVFNGLINYCSDRGMNKEVDYLQSRMWVCKI